MTIRVLYNPTDQDLLSMPIVARPRSLKAAHRHAAANGWIWRNMPDYIFGGYYADTAGNCYFIV
jgi:hypothetical protein